MKIVVRSVTLTLISAVVLLILMAVMGRMNRSTEINSNLSSVMEETLQNMVVDPKYTISNRDEYIADFTEQISALMDTDSDIRVEIEKADKERGMLAVKVTEEFEHPNGNQGTTANDRTVILNKLEEDEPGEFTVKFYLSKEDMNADISCYKTYHLNEGDTVPVPASPQKEGAVFSLWKDNSDYIADFTVPIEQDMVYYAAWN